MAGIEFSLLLDSMSGKLGNVVVKTFKGKPYISRRPDMSRRKLSTKQQTQNGKFKAASQYAKEALKVPEVRALYEKVAESRSKPVVSVAIGDYLNPPEIHTIDASNYHRRAGDTILIHATDDVEVVRVEVAIYNSNGEIIESGAAVRGNINVKQWPEHWLYTAATSLPGDGVFAVAASATDRPGNVAVHAVGV